ncbi:MAG TPA: hypothetical protein VJ476_00975 [Rhizomicrobium sp.]|jgi:hypothetical protein|nr:hypothetical protein [Rhizomicrobium sp.]
MTILIVATAVIVAPVVMIVGVYCSERLLAIGTRREPTRDGMTDMGKFPER